MTVGRHALLGRGPTGRTIWSERCSLSLRRDEPRWTQREQYLPARCRGRVCRPSGLSRPFVSRRQTRTATGGVGECRAPAETHEARGPSFPPLASPTCLALARDYAVLRRLLARREFPSGSPCERVLVASLRSRSSAPKLESAPDTTSVVSCATRDPRFSRARRNRRRQPRLNSAPWVSLSLLSVASREKRKEKKKEKNEKRKKERNPKFLVPKFFKSFFQLERFVRRFIRNIECLAFLRRRMCRFVDDEGWSRHRRCSARMDAGRERASIRSKRRRGEEAWISVEFHRGEITRGAGNWIFLPFFFSSNFPRGELRFARLYSSRATFGLWGPEFSRSIEHR